MLLKTLDINYNEYQVDRMFHQERFPDHLLPDDLLLPSVAPLAPLLDLVLPVRLVRLVGLVGLV
jgi:hypothetical protein